MNSSRITGHPETEPLPSGQREIALPLFSFWGQLTRARLGFLARILGVIQKPKQIALICTS